MGVNITTIVYLRVLIIEIGSTIVLMVVEAQGIYISQRCHHFGISSILELTKKTSQLDFEIACPIIYLNDLLGRPG